MVCVLHSNLHMLMTKSQDNSWESFCSAEQQLTLAITIVLLVPEQARIHTLSGLVDQLRQQLEETRAGEEEARETVRRVEEERAAVVQRLEGEVKQLQRTLERAKTREQKLAQEAQEVRSLQ